jgi:hypothetical protein
MMHFAVGDRVLIRWGRQQGQRAEVIKSLLSDEYKVRREDGAVGYFSGKGLEKEQARVRESG